MAILASKTWIAGEVLTASELNAEFLHIYNNGEDLGWPASKAKDFAGNVLQLSGDQNTTIDAATTDRIDFALSGTDLFRMDGTVSTPVNGLDFVASATGTAVQVQGFGTDTNIDINLVPKGSGHLLINGDPIDDGVRRAAASNIAGRTLRNRVAHIEANHFGEAQSLSF